jgi:hypothetical protein
MRALSCLLSDWKSFKLGSLDTAAYETYVPGFDVHNTAFIVP